MYLDWNSYNSRVNHEGLFEATQCFGKYQDEEDFNENFIIDILKTYKEFNKDRDVIYTCVNVKNDSDLIYKNISWRFAYKTKKECDTIKAIIKDLSETTIIEVKRCGTAECPFKNNGELI